RALAIGTLVRGLQQRLQASGDHDFEIPLGEDRIGILPVQYFALLSDAHLSREISWGLGEDGGMGWSSAATHRTAAPVKQAQVHVALARHGMQVMLSLVEFPGAG